MTKFALTCMGLLVSTLSVTSALAADGHGGGGGHHFVPKTAAPNAAPATRASGSAPIDLKNGVPFANGTFGQRNPEHEKWSQAPTWAVAMAELPYPFEDQAKFSNNLDERIAFFEAAVMNWDATSDRWPEGKAHAEKSKADIQPRIDRARDAWKKAKSAGRGDWDKSQEEAKTAFIDLQSFYRSIHKNVKQ